MSRRWQDWASLVAGAWLLISPWALGFTAETAALWTSVGVGAGVVLVAIWAVAMPHSPFTAWSAAALGAGVILAPWTLSFTGETSAAVNAWITGAVVVVLAVMRAMSHEVGRTPGRRHRPAH